MLKNLNEKKNKIYDLLRLTNEENNSSLLSAYNKFYFDNGLPFYEEYMIFKSFCDVFEQSHNKPMIITYAGHIYSISVSLILMNEWMSGRGQRDRSIIYIHNDGAHITVFYLFQKQKKILHIDFMNPGRKLTLEDENYTLYSSDTKIQKDGYPCGPIASEIARMLHSNYEKVENYLSTRNSNYNLVKLDDFLPREELDQLRESCSKEMTVRYGKDETKINAADYRAAHLMCGLIEKEDALLMTMMPFLEGIHSGFVQKSSQKRKQGAKEIRSFFIGKPDNVELFCQIINDLVCAIEKGHKGSVNDLIKAKANVNIQDGDNVSTSTSSTTPTGGLYGEFAPNTAGFQAAGDKYALHEAARRSDIEKVLNLIKIGYGVNAKDDDGWTPLHWAASEGYKEVVKKLINARADVNAKDDDGKTARDVTEDDDIKNLLEEAGKTDNTSPIISETEVENHNTSATPTTSSSTKTANKNTNTTFWSEHKGRLPWVLLDYV